MAIVMGLDQHRAQITADWLDTETGEVLRRRVSPAHRAGVRAFCEQFRGQQLEVALEATTGWRFVAEEGVVDDRSVAEVVEPVGSHPGSPREGTMQRSPFATGGKIGAKLDGRWAVWDLSASHRIRVNAISLSIIKTPTRSRELRAAGEPPPARRRRRRVRRRRRNPRPRARHLRHRRDGACRRGQAAGG
jgi:hypothetical protein